VTSIAVIDCGVGNLLSVCNAFAKIGASPVLVSSPDDVGKFDRFVLPGVGAAGYTLARLRDSHLDEALAQAVLRQAKPILAICVGMQVMTQRLFEQGEHLGLGWLDGEVVDLKPLATGLAVPHMGWSHAHPQAGAGELFARAANRNVFYFCHSFAVTKARPETIAATSTHGISFVSAFKWQNIFATQFHPEKSQYNGELLLSAFMDWKP
jgi:glutamine amidotransferase